MAELPLSTTVSAPKGLPVLRGVIELDQTWIELLYQNSDDIHEEHKIDRYRDNNRPLDDPPIG